MATIYRNYDVAKVGDTFVGQSEDDGSLMVSRDHSRLMSAIDQMWDCLDRGGAPAWFCGSSAIDLDAVNLNATGGPESVPSETDPPKKDWKVPYWLFGFAAVGVSAPIAFVIDLLGMDARIDVILSLAVCAVALSFGRNYALMAAGIAAVITNFFGVDPILHFSLPTLGEIVTAAVDFAAAWTLPMFIKEEERYRLSRE